MQTSNVTQNGRRQFMAFLSSPEVASTEKNLHKFTKLQNHNTNADCMKPQKTKIYEYFYDLWFYLLNYNSIVMI